MRKAKARKAKFREVEQLKAKQAKGKGDVIGCAIEVCLPALDLREVPKRRTNVHKLACVKSDQTRNPTYAVGEDFFPVAAAVLEDISDVAMSAISESQKHFEPTKETMFNAQIMQFVDLTPLC